MELIIKIDKELYEAYKGKPPMLGDAGMDMIAQAITNGTPYNPTGDCISREALRNVILNDSKLDGANANWEVNRILVHIDNAPPVPQVTVFTETADEKAIEDMKAELQSVIEPRPQGKWYDFIPNCLKARHGDYVLYKVDFLLDNLAREVNIMESARRMKGGTE